MFSSNKIHIVSITKLNRTMLRVNCELDDHGLWYNGVEDVEVSLGGLGTALGTYGWIASGDAGKIVIPAVSLSKLGDIMRGTYTPLADVLRHEYGHAIANMNKGLVRSRRFTAAFGATYDNEDEFEYSPEFHVSEYAATNASEDFAETFMLFLKHKGDLPTALDWPDIRAKWLFIRRLCSNVRRGRARWNDVS